MSLDQPDVLRLTTHEVEGISFKLEVNLWNTRQTEMFPRQWQCAFLKDIFF